MAQLTDVFYGFCTFWTDDWEWLAKQNGADPTQAKNAMPEAVVKALAESGVTVQPRHQVRESGIPHCPFCGSVGFEVDREVWLRQAREWEDGTSPNGGGPHPGYVVMLMWGKNKCFKNYEALERAWLRRS